MAVFCFVAPLKTGVSLPGITTQKTAIFILTTVRTSSHTWNENCWSHHLFSEHLKRAVYIKIFYRIMTEIKFGYAQHVEDKMMEVL
jgi:hypothetical protein